MYLNEEHNTEPRKIIVVEDDENMLLMITQTLRIAGFDVVTANTTATAIHAVNDNPTALLLTDYMLNLDSAKDLIKELSELGNAQIPFVVMTGQGDENLAVEMMKMGALDYIVKDASFSKLLVPRIKNVFNAIETKNSLIKSEHGLKSTSRLYSALFESAKEGIYFVTKDGEFIEINNYMLQMLGYSHDEIMTLRVFDLYHNPDDRNAFINEIDNKGFVKDYKLILKKKNGQEFPCSVSATVFCDYDNTVIGYQGIIHDLSSILEYEKTLKYRIEFEALLNKISSRLINASSANINEIIEETMAMVGRFTGMDRIALFQKGQEPGTAVLKTYWLRNKDEENQYIKSFGKINKDLFPKLFSNISSLETLNFCSIESVSYDELPEKDTLIEFGLKSILLIPITFKNKVKGSLALVSSSEEKCWSDEDISLLKVFGEVIINSLEKAKYESALEREALLNSDYAEISYAINLGGSIEEISNIILKKIIKITQSSFGFVGYVDPDNENLIKSAFYCNEEMASKYSEKDFEFCGQDCICKKTILSNDPSSLFNLLPEESALCRLGNLLAVPAVYSNKQLGQIVIGESARDYTEDDLHFLERVATLFAFQLHRKNMEDSLRHSEENYRLLAETARDIIIVHDLKGKIQYINKSGLEAMDYDESEIRNISYFDLTPKECHSGINERISNRLSGFFKPMLYELELKNKSGARIPVEINSLPIIQNNAPKDILLIARDITQRKRDEEAKETINIVSLLILSSKTPERLLNELTKLFSVRFKLELSLIEIFDIENNAVNIFGGDSLRLFSEKPNLLPLDRSLSKDVIESASPYIETDIILPDDYSNFVLSSHKLNVIMVYPIKTKEKVFGSIVIGGKKADTINSLLDAFDTISFMIAQDMERRKAEAALMSLNAELEKRVIERTYELQQTLNELREENAIRKKTEDELLKAKDEIARALIQEKQLSELKMRFIAMISHEYRTPLTVILSSAYIIEKAIALNQTEFYEKHIDKIKTSVSVMTQLLENVLMIGKTEAGKLDYNPTSLDLQKLIHDIIEEVNVIDKEQHEIVFNHSGSLNSIYTDEKIIRQIVVNLLTNAAKYSEPNTKIDIVAAGFNDYIKLSVADKGIGIPDKDKEMIFESFHRGINIGAIQGTGIGLTIVKRCVDMLNGEIAVESEIGKGAKFVVRFPKDNPK